MTEWGSILDTQNNYGPDFNHAYTFLSSSYLKCHVRSDCHHLASSSVVH